MAFVQTVATPKGGSGKSTAVCNLAAMYVAIGYRVAVLDTDIACDQASAGNWVMTRSGTTLPQVKLVMISSGEEVQHAISRLRSDPNIDIVIVDVSGRDSNLNRAALRVSDAWLIPVKPTQNDLARVPYIQQMADQLLVEHPEIMINLFLNEAPTTNRIETRDAVAFLRDLGIEPMAVVIHSRKAYRDCIKEGMGVTEMKNTDGRAIEEFSGFFAELMQDYRVLLEQYSNNVRIKSEYHKMIGAGGMASGI